MTKRQDALIRENLAWARQIARHVASMLPSRFTIDDLTGPACVALVQVAAKYDSKRVIPFQIYAQRRIYGACFDAIRRKEYKERSHLPLADTACPRPSPEQQLLAAEQ